MEWRNDNYLKSLLQRIEAGETIRGLARELEIPFSTLKDYLARVQSAKPLPNYLGYQKAVEDVLVRGMSIRESAKLNNLPKSTVGYHVKQNKD